MVAVVRHQRTGIGRLKQRVPRCLQYSVCPLGVEKPSWTSRTALAARKLSICIALAKVPREKTGSAPATQPP